MEQGVLEYKLSQLVKRRPTAGATCCIYIHNFPHRLRMGRYDRQQLHVRLQYNFASDRT